MAKAFRAILILLPLLIFTRARAEEFYLPAEIVSLADLYTTEDVKSDLIQAVIWTESRGTADAVSADGLNIGLMQLHVWYFSGDLTDPENNIQQGAAYLQSLYDKYGDMSVALMAYHGETDLTKEPSYYARSILKLSKEIRKDRVAEGLKKASRRRQAWRLKREG